MAIKSIFFLTYFIQILVSDIIVNRPSNGTGPIIISDEDLENYYYNPDRILFVFNRSCIANIDEDDEELIQRINTIKDKYSDCMKETGNNRNKTSYDTAKYSYVFFDLLCSIYSLSENSSITIDYDDLCIAYIQYEPLFNVTQETESIQPQTVAINTPEFACMRGNTDYFESYGMDLLDSDKMDYRYSYPQFTNVTISNERKIDIYVLDSGIQSNHEEFENYQIIHRLGDGPAIYPNDGSEIQKYGDHGTHVAGLASGKNYGSSRNFTIFDYRVCEFTSNGQDMPCYGSLIFEALFSVWEDLKAKGKPSVINLSLGGPKSTSLDDAYQHYFEELIKVGGIPVVAAGNEDVDACTVSPAYSDNAITVGSYNKKREKSDFSNWGDCVDIWAPGTSIYSAVASDRDNKYEYKQGTSMATPYISGMVANLLYINPSLTFDDIRQILLDTTKSVSGDKCNDYSCPRAQYTCESALVYDLPYKLSTLDIVLIVLGSIAGVCIISMIVLYCIKKKKERDQDAQNENDWQYNQREYEKEMNKKKGKGKVKVHDNSHEAEMQHMNPNTEHQPQQLVIVEE